jgi:predicted phosphodiesterase
MSAVDFPLIISPNLGCPKIISIDEVEQGKTIDIILAGQYGEYSNISKEMFEGVFKLVSSFKEDKMDEISLVIDDIEELTGWNRLFDFSSTEETQHLINSEFHYNVLGENTRYWLIKTKPSKKNDLLKIENVENKKKKLPTLYDLEFIEKFSEKPEKQEKSDNKTKLKQINYHAVQFVETFNKGLNFIHLTDLHIAQRNDEILEEVLKIEHEDKMGLIDNSSFFPKKEKEKIRSREEIKNSYINFNDNFRKFIQNANEKAKHGELDFIVITGDIVDFAGLGWFEEIGPAENNWKIFIDIVTGKGNEDKTDFWSNISNNEKDKPGLNIAIFTSSGNHDWRMHPGSLLPYVGEGECKKFGLTEVEAKNYNYKSFDSTEYSDERKKMADALVSKILIVFEKKWWAQYIPLLILIGIKLPEGTSINYLFYGALLFISYYLKKIVRKIADFIVDNPSHAEAKALHYYFKHINPYFDYAFSFGGNHFILMDTGVDAITVGAKELMDAKDTKYLKKVSVMDNAIGMSPDSMAFDDRQAFYNWSQIVWLDKVLTGISKNKNNTKENIIICVHAPPLNFDYKYKTHLKALSESLRRTKSSPKYVKELSELEYIFNSILIKYKLIKIKIPLFYWNDVPETNDGEFIEFLKHEYAFEWVKEAQIEKINNGNAIKVSNGKNELILQLNDKKTEVELTFNSIRIDILIAKSDKNKLRIYKNNMKRINLTYGTINHYLSQFFFLCRGMHENPNRRIEPDKESDLKKVNLVLSGHAHIKVEFRIDIEPENQEKKVRIYHDEYSTEYPDNFYDSETFIVQTAACGPHGDDADSPPYWRMITVNKENRIISFKQENLKK